MTLRNFTYETMYILRPELIDEQVNQNIETYQGLVRDNGGEILETQHRGKRRLAYEIAGQREGVYIQMNYTAPGKTIAALERAMRLSDEVIRYLTVKQEIEENSEPVEEAIEE
ncbi:30S ribosomal protein S6 [Roseofilum casamattae]|uniref:30S ribosomal protein S6 n=1 Tax=Roseofilum casamattae TaxID=3082944 RepID=UPI0024BDCFD1|nr:30S ribosomal protein S6 [Roseofilum casamattae]